MHYSFGTSFLSQLAKIIASFLYVGFIPVIPGTFGSLASFIFYFPLLYTGSWHVYLVAIILIVGAGIWAAGRVAGESRIVDPSFVVIDEVAGQLITLFLIPFSWAHLLAGFFLFRIMDIIKPFPGRQAENLPGGYGIMTDDVLAGIYANVSLRLLLFLKDQILPVTT
jgi:phosphatidylglycerophosphatase A